MAGIICGLHQRIVLGNIVGLENNNIKRPSLEIIKKAGKESLH